METQNESLNNEYLKLYRPGKNALREVSVVIFITESLRPISLYENLTQKKDEYPYYTYFHELDSFKLLVHFNNQEANSNINKTPRTGFRLSDKNFTASEDNAPIWAIQFINDLSQETKTISISNYQYENWRLFSKEVQKIFLDIKNMNPNHTIEIEAIGINWLNQFNWKDPNRTYPNYQDYINFDSKWLPKGLIDSQLNLKCSLSYHKEESENRALNQNINIHFAPANDDYIFILNNQLIYSFNQPIILNEDSYENQLKIILDIERQLNNHLICDILQKSVYNRFESFVPNL